MWFQLGSVCDKDILSFIVVPFRNSKLVLIMKSTQFRCIATSNLPLSRTTE
jgi:hypothetical protein